MLIDTHCHIHSADYPLDTEEVISRARRADVQKIICVGTDEADSRRAIDFAMTHDDVFAAIGVHPHYAAGGIGQLAELAKLAENNPKIVAIGEIGLDYYYNNSPREAQIEILQAQIEIAIAHNLPIIFHVRDAYEDFWSVLDNLKQPIRGVLHCFTGTAMDAEEGVKRGLYFGLNGISTFTRDNAQKAMFAGLTLDRIVLETDAPFLTPDPLRGRIKVNEPAYVKEIAEHASASRQVSFEEIATTTTNNARSLFNL